MKNDKNKPNFLMVGAAKSGTTSIAAYLNEHPEIFIPETKEPKYFLYDIFKDINKKDPMYDMLMQTSVLEWEDYLKLYEVTVPEVKYFGDASVQYLYHYDTVIPKVKEKLGDIPIIIILRNPVDRAYSNYKYQAAGQIISFEQALEEEEKIKREKYNSFWYYKGLGMYSKQVKAYKNNFSQVYIGLYDDFKSDPVNFMQELYTFLQVDRNFIPETTKKHNVRDVPINKLVHYLYYFKRQKKLELNLLPLSVRSFLKKSLFIKSNKKMSFATEQELKRYYKEDVRSLEKIIGRDLSVWKI